MTNACSAQLAARRDAAQRAPRRSSRRARSASSTRCSTGSPRSASAAASGAWVWDLPPEPDVYRQDTDAAIARLQDQLTGSPTWPTAASAAWSTVVGHTTCSDPLWQAARALADEHGVGMSFHMSPATSTRTASSRQFGQRPMVHLDELGVLADDVCVTHCVHVDDAEIGRHRGDRLERRALPDHRTEGQLRRDPDRQDARDGAARRQRRDRHRRQQRVQLLRHDARHVPGGRAVQGRPPGPADVPGRDGLRDGHARRRTVDAAAGPDRFARGRQACRPRAPRHRPPRVASPATT